MRGRTLLLTVGPTREHLDPVRFLTNSSSGKMGWALAAEALRRGAKVVAIAGPGTEKAPSGVQVLPVTTALEMREAALAEIPRADVFIAAAAVGDWRFQNVSRSKLKSGAPVTLELVPNPDIAAEIGALRRNGKLKARALVGFALETDDVIAHAKGKLERKGLDLIIANDPKTLSNDKIRFAVIGRNGSPKIGAPVSKAEAAKKILDAIEALL